MYKIGFIGCGNMGEAFLKGIVDSKSVKTKDIYVYDRHKNADLNHKYGVSVANDEIDLVTKVDMIFLAVKPNVYFDVLKKIKKSLKNTNVLVTMAPGISMKDVLEVIGEDKKIVRTMPNLPLMVQEGTIAYAFGENLKDIEKITIREIFEKIGIVFEIKENLFDAVVGASGSSPAFIFMFIEAIADAVVAEGLPRGMAYKMIGQTVVGSGKLFLEKGEHPGVLKDAICSPGGTTIEGVNMLEKRGFRGCVIDCINATIKKSKSLNKN